MWSPRTSTRCSRTAGASATPSPEPRFAVARPGSSPSYRTSQEATPMKAAITVLRPREEVERLWQSFDPLDQGTVTFVDAPGDRGTEIHVDVEGGGMVQKLKG